MGEEEFRAAEDAVRVGGVEEGRGGGGVGPGDEDGAELECGAPVGQGGEERTLSRAQERRAHHQHYRVRPVRARPHLDPRLPLPPDKRQRVARLHPPHQLQPARAHQQLPRQRRHQPRGKKRHHHFPPPQLYVTASVHQHPTKPSGCVQYDVGCVWRRAVVPACGGHLTRPRARRGKGARDPLRSLRVASTALHRTAPQGRAGQGRAGQRRDSAGHARPCTP